VNRRRVTQLHPPRGYATGLAYAPRGSLLAVAATRQTGGLLGPNAAEIQLWNPATRRRLATLPESGDPFEFSPDGRLLASAHAGLQLWNVATRRRVGDSVAVPVEPDRQGAPWDLAFSRDGARLAVATGVDVRLLTTAALAAP
jgi:WD40 repeat protein